MSKPDPDKKIPPGTPAPRSGTGADSALQAMIRKRPPRPGAGEPGPQNQTQDKLPGQSGR
jgi:hypothetical protein